jgi:hypothetical protein
MSRQQGKGHLHKSRQFRGRTNSSYDYINKKVIVTETDEALSIAQERNSKNRKPEIHSGVYIIET